MAVEMEDFLGLVFKTVELSKYGDEVRFTTHDDQVYCMLHHQDCCETVDIDDIAGDLQDLVDSPILLARESSSDDMDTAQIDILDGEEQVMYKLGADYAVEDDTGVDSQTWTFYLFSTIKGSVTLRWYGSSNGYYSESVDIIKEDRK
jgi:hypothetical protein